MNIALTEDQALLQSTFDRLLMVESTPARIRSAGPVGHDPALWRQLVDLGAPAMRAGETADSSMTLLDAALVAEVAGTHLASAPLIEAVVALALLVKHVGSEHPLVKQAEAGDQIITLALTDAAVAPDQILPGGAVATAALALRDNALVLIRDGGKPHLPNTGNLPLARWDLSGGEVIARGDAARATYEAAVEEWRLLSAACLIGSAQKSLDLAADYARERRQFGRPIGSFQGLAHPLADSLADVEAGRLLLWRAITAISNHDREAGGLSAMACWWATQAAGGAARRALRAFGGYGLSLEYDIQLYHRRIVGLTLIGGDPQALLAIAGERLFKNAQVSLPDAGDATMEFNLPASALEAGRQLSEFIDANRTPRMVERAHHSTSSHDADFHRQLATAGFILGGWKSAGDQATTAAAAYARFAALEAGGYTTHVISTTDMVGQIVEQFGSDAAREEIVPRIKAGEAVCSLGFSEPSSGSDVFSARTRATADGDEWIIDGQKMFTTAGHYADYVLLLLRTDPAATGHEGLTLFVVPTSLPGYQFQAVETYQDERTNITFYSEMRVPDHYRLGAVGSGAKVMTAALALEHSAAGSMFHAQVIMMDAAQAWGRARVTDTAPLDRPDIRARFAAIVARFEAARSLVQRSLWAADTGKHHRAWGPMAKMFVTESHLRNAWELMEMGAPESGLTGTHPLGVVELGHRRAYGSTIYGGTSEVHRSLVAEQGLGMPKSRS